MTKNLLKVLFAFVLAGTCHEATGQIEYAFSGSGACNLTQTFIYAGQVNGRNSYSATFSGSTGVFSWNSTDERWELNVTIGTRQLAFYNTADVGPDPPCYGIGTWVNVWQPCGSAWAITGSTQYCYPHAYYATDCGGGFAGDLFFAGTTNGKYAFKRVIAPNSYNLYWEIAGSPRWVLSANSVEYFYNTAPTSPLPPDDKTGTWVGVGGCAGSSVTASDGNVLPVELLFFEVLPDGMAYEANWATASESYNDRFEIEYSTDGKSWSHVATVEGSGTSKKQINYSTSFAVPMVLEDFYVRLVQYDFDGKAEIFPAEFVQVKSMLSDNLSVYPNPCFETIRLKGVKSGKFHIYNTSGVIVYKGKLDSYGASISMHDLPDGIYLLVINSGNKSLGTRIIKQ